MNEEKQKKFDELMQNYRYPYQFNSEEKKLLKEERKERIEEDLKNEYVVEARFSTKEEAEEFFNRVLAGPDLGEGTIEMFPYYPRYYYKDRIEEVIINLKGMWKKFSTFVSSTI